MLSTWGGNGGDTITEEELTKEGYDTCKKYCSEYCWGHGFGYCNNCALDKERERRRRGERNESKT